MDEAIELAIEERDRDHGGLVRKFAYVSDAGHARFREKRARARRLSRALVFVPCERLEGAVDHARIRLDARRSRLH